MRNKIIILVLLAQTSFLQGQNNTKSIYSYYGLGEFQSANSITVKTLGGSSMGMMPGSYPNLANPISIAGRKMVDFDIAIEANTRLLKTQTAERTALAGTVNYVSLAFNTWHRDYKIRDTFGNVVRKIPVRHNMMFGLSPYSAMNYEFSVQGDTTTNRTLLSAGGKGSLTSLHINQALQLLDTQLTFGFSYQYIFGTLLENKLKNLLNDSNSIGYEQSINQRISGRIFGVSANYSGNLSAKKGYKQTIGAEYQFSSNFNNDALNLTRTVQNFFEVKDTLFNNQSKGKIAIPSKLSVGYGIQNKNLWAISLDYTSQKMSSYSNPLSPSTLVDISRYSLGFMVNPKRAENSGSGLSKIKSIEWRTGFFYQTGPYAVKINNSLTPISEYGINFGAGIPMVKKYDKQAYTSYVNLGVQYSQRGNTNNGLVMENVLRLNLSVSLSDLWFRRYNYN